MCKYHGDGYKELDDALVSKAGCCPLCLNDFAPSNRYTRRHWFDKVALPYKVMIMKYPHGNSLGTLCFILRVPEQIDDAQNARLMLHLSQEVYYYSTREMRWNSLRSIAMPLEFPRASFVASIRILQMIHPVPRLLQGDVDE